MTIRTEFWYAESGSKQFPTLGERLDRAFGDRATSHRVILGELDIVLRNSGRWESLEIRSNPSGWLDESLPDLTEEIPEVWAEFRLEFDENNLASAQEATIAVAWDSKRSRLALRLQESRPSASWSALADTVIIAVDSERHLTEIRIDVGAVAV